MAHNACLLHTTKRCVLRFKRSLGAYDTEGTTRRPSVKEKAYVVAKGRGKQKDTFILGASKPTTVCIRQ